MSTPERESRVIRAKPPAAREDRSESHENRTLPSDLRLAGTVCQFLHVEGRGDGEVARLAGLQHGHIHRQQLYAAGMGRSAITHD
jgi:hypothetical protein